MKNMANNLYYQHAGKKEAVRVLSFTVLVPMEVP
jgi:hypothetical protein